MKKANSSPPDLAKDDMLPEYDFTGKKGVRGKYYQAYRQGHTVRVRHANGTVTVRYFTLEDGAVMLEPDVREHFPNSRAVNRALRSLIPSLPGGRHRRTAFAGPRGARRPPHPRGTGPA